MKPVKRKTTNTIFKRPDCYDLPGTKYKYEDETPAIETCWELNDIELEKIKKTRKIYIQQEGETLAPMAVSANSVLADGEEEIEHFKNMIEKKEIKDNNYFLRTQTNEGFNVANINCYQIKKIEKEVKS